MNNRIRNTLILSALLASQSAFATAPGTPVISWMPNSYDSGDALQVKWNMWWGKNATSWQLIDNDTPICNAELTANGNNAQTGKCSANYTPGTHKLIVKLCNSNGCTSSTASTISVAGGVANIKPTVELTVPVVAIVNNEVQLKAIATDVDGNVSSVVFYQGTTLLGTDNSAPYSFSYTPTQIGTAEFSAVATDNLAAQASANASLKVIEDGGNELPDGEKLILSRLPLQINLDQTKSKTYLFDEEISKVTSRKNGQLSSWKVDGQSVTINGELAGRTGLKITTEAGDHYYMGLRINHADGSMPGLPKYLSVGSVSEDTPNDLDFWKDIDGDLTNKNMDIRYVYINGGPSGDNFQQGWQTWSKLRAGRFAKESIRFGLVPFYVYYNIPAGSEDFNIDLQHARDPLYMNDYFQDLNTFMEEAQTELKGELYGIILEPDFLGYMQQGGVSNLGTNDPTKISSAVAETEIATGIGSIRTMVERINKTINDKRLEGHNIFFGWQLNLWAYAPTSGSKGVLRRTDENDLGWDAGRAAIDEAAQATTQYGIDAGILTHGADFISIDKYGLDAMIHQNKVNPADSTWFWSNDHWQNYLQFVKVMQQTSQKPIVLWQLPVGHINGSTTTSAYTGQAFPALDNTATKGEDSTTTYFFGDTFDSGDDLRLNYFSNNKANDKKLSVSGNTITWGSHMQEAKDAGVIVALFGAGVGASTDGVGSPATDNFFWIQKAQTYYKNGTVALDKEYGTGGYVCELNCGALASFTDLVKGSEIRLPVLGPVTINANAVDKDGSVTSLALEIAGKIVSQFTRVAETDNFTADWLPEAFANYTLTLVAVDNEGNVTRRSVNIDLVAEGTCTVTPWESNVTYSQPGTRISHEGYLYENKYYIKGEAPSLDAPTWGVWALKGPCN